MKIGKPFSCGCRLCATGKWVATNIPTGGRWLDGTPMLKHMKVFKL